MRRIALAAVAVTALMSPTAVSAYSFGDWASDQGYSPGDALPLVVDTDCPFGGCSTAIDSLDGIGDFDWITTPTTYLRLFDNNISSIDSGAFSGLTNLTEVTLAYNQITSIEAGDFSGLTSLTGLNLTGNQISSIEAGAFSGLTSLTGLNLGRNPLTSIEADAFSGLTNLTELNLWNNPLTSIESGAFSSGAFSGLTSLTGLYLNGNFALTELNLSKADFSSLRYFDVYNTNITIVSLKNTVLNQTSLATLLAGGYCGFFGDECIGIGELDGVTEMDLSGIDFGNITDLAPLYAMDDLTDLWLSNTQNMDAVGLDALLDNLETIEGTETEGVLYMTQADFDTFNADGAGLLAKWHAEPGHHVAIIPEPSSVALLTGLAAIGLFTRLRRCVV